MKYSTLVLLSLAFAGNVAAFAPAPSSRQTTTSLSSHKNGDRWGMAVASAIAGLTFATQAAFGSVDILDDVPLPTMLESSPSSTTVTLAGSFDTMDFSMPSYGDAVAGTVKQKGDPPAFTPFGDFEFKKKEEFVIEQPKPLEKEEFKIPSFSAPKVEAAPPAIAAPAAIEDVKLPSFSMPKIDIPKIEREEPSKPVEMPKIEMPKMDMPKMEMAKMEMPKMEMPKMEMPKMEMPKMEMPKMDMPKMDMPKFDIPKMEMPKMSTPQYDFDVSLPSAPKVDIPKVDMPKIDFPNPFGGGGSSSPADDVPLEPREVRDERARETRAAFLASDQDVKDAEEALRVLKEVRSVKKQIANDAKDLACADRVGGKLVCLRNPFQTGF